MNYRKRFLVTPGTKVKLDHLDPGYTGKHLSEDEARDETEAYRKKLGDLQYLAYAEGRYPLLIVLQGMDAAGKDGVVRHVMSAMGQEGTTVTAFKQPTAEDLRHDFLWRVHPHVPARGAVAIFNRSHYEDVLVVRAHKLVSRKIWSARYDLINNFEKLLSHDNDTQILKFFLHISREEQLQRFKDRLDDPTRNWKISEDDYRERERWDDFRKAYEDAITKTSTKHAPWYVIPSNHKWFRNLAISQIVASTLEGLKMRMPKPHVDLDMIREEYHQAAKEGSRPKARQKAKK